MRTMIRMRAAWSCLAFLGMEQSVMYSQEGGLNPRRRGADRMAMSTVLRRGSWAPALWWAKERFLESQEV